MNTICQYLQQPLIADLHATLVQSPLGTKARRIWC